MAEKDVETTTSKVSAAEQDAFLQALGDQSVPGKVVVKRAPPKIIKRGAAKNAKPRKVGTVAGGKDAPANTKTPHARVEASPRRAQDLSAAVGKDLYTFNDVSWKEFLTLIANGAKKPDLLKKMGITNASFNIWIHATKGAAAEYENARLQWVRREWPLELIEDIMVDIAMRKPITDICKERGLSEPSFYKVVLSEPHYSEMFDDARQIAMEAYADDLIKEVDNIELDGQNTTANSAKVNKARLKSDNLKFLMERLHPKRFGRTTKQQIDLHTTVDHAAELGKARKRKEGAAALKTKLLEEAGSVTVH